MPVVQLLLHLLSGNMKILAVGADNIVAAVCARIVDAWFVFAHEYKSDLRCESSKWSWFSAQVNGMPGAGVG